MRRAGLSKNNEKTTRETQSHLQNIVRSLDYERNWSWHHLVTEAFVFVARLIFSASVQIPPSTRMGGVREIQLTNLKYAPFAENLDQQYLAVFSQKGSKITRAVVNQAVHMCFGL